MTFSDILSKYVDFMSIGTNDLVQYILAIDRIDDEVTSLYDPTNPAVLQLIKQVIGTCNRSRIDITVCGEMAGEKMYTKLLLGLGLTSFSMHPQAIPEIKNLIMQTDTKALKSKIEGLDIRVLDTKIKMQNKMAEEALAGFILKQLKL